MAGTPNIPTHVTLLSRDEFLATFGEPMRENLSEEPPFDFWPYFASIPSGHFEGHDCSAGSVRYVWRHPAGTYEHVLVDSEDKNVFMVLVLDVLNRKVHGHHLLDLRREYGLDH